MQFPSPLTRFNTTEMLFYRFGLSHIYQVQATLYQLLNIKSVHFFCFPRINNFMREKKNTPKQQQPHMLCRHEPTLHVSFEEYPCVHRNSTSQLIILAINVSKEQKPHQQHHPQKQKQEQMEEPKQKILKEAQYSEEVRTHNDILITHIFKKLTWGIFYVHGGLNFVNLLLS